MTTPIKSSAAGETGSILQIVELGQRPGDLLQISEPLNPLHLTAGMWPETYRQISTHIPRNPGTYVLVGEDEDGEHPVYVGEAGNVLERLRTHGVPKKMKVIWFAVISSTYPTLSKTHIRGVEAGLYRTLEQVEGVRILGVAPSLFPMSPADAAAVDGALATMKRFLGYAGFPLDVSFLDDKGPVPNDEGADGKPASTCIPRTYATYRFTSGPGTAYADLHAVGSDLDDGFMIHAGAEYRPVVSHALNLSILTRRERLENGGFLEPIPGVTGRLRLKRSVMVGSALIAAKVLAGYGINDPKVWQPLDGSPVEVR
jgi:hypothetical protein